MPSKHIRRWRQASGNLFIMTNDKWSCTSSKQMYRTVSNGYQTTCGQQGVEERTVARYYGLTFSKVVLHHQPLGASSQSPWFCTCLTSESVSCGENFPRQECSSPAMTKMTIWSGGECRLLSGLEMAWRIRLWWRFVLVSKQGTAPKGFLQTFGHYHSRRVTAGLCNID